MRDRSEEFQLLDFGVEKSIRYHQRRQAHYVMLDQVFTFLIIISGSASFAQLGVQFGRPEWFGGAAALFGAINFVAGFSHKARDHAVLQKRFTDLAAEMRSALQESEEDIGRWERRRIEIETEESKIMYALDAWCDNEVRRAWGLRHDGFRKIRWWHRPLMNWISFSATEFRLEKSEEAQARPGRSDPGAAVVPTA